MDARDTFDDAGFKLDMIGCLNFILFVLDPPKNKNIFFVVVYVISKNNLQRKI